MASQKLERVQHRCQKLSSGDLHLPPLAQRRMKADMRETFKLINGHYRTDPDSMFNIARHSGLRGHHLKLSKVNSRTEVRQQFFCNRVINNWNGLDENIVSAPLCRLVQTPTRAEQPLVKALNISSRIK